MGHYTYHLLQALGRVDPENQYVLFYLNAFRRSRRIPFPAFPYSNFSTRGAVFPNRLLGLLARVGAMPLFGLEMLVGPVDLFHSPNYVLLPQWRGRRVITIHDLTLLLFPQFHPAERREVLGQNVAAAARRADRIIADSHCTKRDVVRLLGMPPEKVTVIHLAPAPAYAPREAADVAPVLERFHIQFRGYLLHVGTIEPRKNLVRLLRAYARLRREGFDLPLVLAGPQGWDNGEAQRSAEALCLGQVVVWTGYLPEEDLVALTAGAGAVAFPSLYEGFGLPVVEAMAAGTPVVTSATSSLPEVAGDAALLVDPQDEDGLAAALRRILKDRDLWEDLRRRGLARARTFSWERTARETLAVYRAAVGGADGRRS
ncbi:MAG: glycosyltransferase family 4 protein [Candidatus Rokubacteria bacterium]|nr:glycosyltransferase family 4 protein [Candidatus Rokubacteria bacterium]